MIFELVTLEEAKSHQRIDDSADDQDVDRKIRMASAIAMQFMKRTEMPEDWIDTYSPPVYDIPFDIQAATLLMFGELWENREGSISNVLSDAVKALLWPYRDPTMA